MSTRQDEGGFEAGTYHIYKVQEGDARRREKFHAILNPILGWVKFQKCSHYVCFLESRYDDRNIIV